MSIVPAISQLAAISSVPSTAQVLKAAIQLAQAADRVYSSLPAFPVKKDKNLAKSTIERKMAPKNNKKGQANTTTKNIRRAVVDESFAGSSGSMAQRSLTSGYAMGRSNRGPARKSWGIRFNGLQSINNGSTNESAGQLVAAVNQTLFPTAVSLGDVVTQSAALGGIFREFRIKRIEANYVPRVGSQTQGSIGFCFDRDPRAGAVSTMSSVIRKTPYFEVDIKQPGSFVWLPIDEEDKRWRYTSDSGRPQESLSFGSILWFSRNEMPLGWQVGDLEITVDFEFAVTY